MLEKILGLFSPAASAMPHGYCLLWQKELVWLHVVANALIALSYLAIPAFIYIFIRKKHKNLVHQHLFWLFVSFIIACALTHLMGIMVIWRPYYQLQGLIMAVAAIVSVLAAVELVRQMPTLLKLPTIKQLQEINEELAQQIIHRALLEQKLRLTQFSIDHAGEGIYWINPDASIRYANQAASDMLGYELTEFLTLKVSDINPEHSVNAWDEHWQELKKAKTLSFEAPLLKKDQSLAWFEITANFIEYEGKEYNCAFVRDISEQKVAKNALLESQNILQASESMLKQAQEIAHVGHWILDLNSNKLSWSDEIYRILGAQPEDFSPSYQTFLKCVHPDDRAFVDYSYNIHLKTQADYNIVHRLLLRDGSVKYVNEKCKTSFDAQGTPLQSVGVVLDITDRQESEHRLHDMLTLLTAAEEKNRLILNSTGEGIYGMNVKGEATFINDAACKILGFSANEFVNQSVHTLIHHSYPDGSPYPFDKCPMYLAFTQGINNKITDEVLWRKDGTYFSAEYTCNPIIDNFEIIGAVIVFSDITQRKQAEQRISDLLDLNQKIISQSSVGVKVFSASGQCVACNDAAAETLGKTKEQVLQENFYTLNFWKSSHLFNTAQRCLQQKTPQRQEIQTILSSGKEVWLDYHFATFNSNEETHLLVLIHDVTEYRQAEIALREAELVAVRANQAKSEFVANMSHEIRTPMNAILGFSTILTDLISDPTQQYYLSAIKRSGKTLLQLINDILDLSKIEAGKFNLQYTPVMIKALLEDIAIIFSQKAIDKSIEIFVEIAADFPACLRLDEIRLRQILLNLVGNAVKFTENGFVKIIARKQANQNEGQINLTIEVCDSGVGIAKDQQEKIFAAFTQQDHQNAHYGGTGLGLTICKRLLELMGGQITVESDIGKGSCFTLHLQNIEVVENSVSPLQTLAEPQPTSRIHFHPARILLVDDMPFNRLLIISYLAEFAELTVIEAETGEQALTLLEQQVFDLVLMDRRLPGDDGDAICRKIRRMPDYANVPIIMITASVLTVAEKHFPVAFDVQLEKPLNKDKLLTTLECFLLFEIEQPIPASVDVLPLQTECETEIPQLLSLLESQYLPVFNEWHESGILDVDQLIVVGEQLKICAEKHHSVALKQWAQQLITDAELFDLTHLSVTLKNFKELLRNYSASPFEEGD
jgi:PAS domain S-box-containing protein